MGFGLSALTNASAMAVRSHNHARANLEKSIARLSTGQKLSSVKDDGAAYITKTVLNNESDAWDWRSSELQRFSANSELNQFIVEEGLTLQRKAQQILAFAANTQAGSSERQKYALEWAELGAQQTAIINARNMSLENYGSASLAMTGYGGEWAFDPYNYDGLLGDVTIVDAWWMGVITTGQAGAGYTPTVITVNADFLNATQANLTQAATEMAGSGAGIARSIQRAVPGIAGSVDKIDRLKSFSDKMNNIFEDANSQIYDADVEIESARLSAAQARIELSQNAISLFSNSFRKYVTGLLGFVMNSQQSIFRTIY